MKNFFLLLFISSWLATGCSSPRQDSQSNPSLVGYKLIDQGRADEAIDHFRSLLEANPDSDEYRRGLSSAFALRGGFRVQILVKPMRDIQQADSLKSEYESIFQKMSTNSSVLKSFEKTLQLQIELMIFLKKFDSVPEISSSQTLDLKTAISTLRLLKSFSPGDSLYIAVLESLILKHNLSSPIVATSCDEYLAGAKERIQNSSRHFGKILSLLSTAMPSQAASYEKQQIDLDRISKETSLLTTSSLMTLSLIQNVSTTDSQPRLIFHPPQCDP